MARQGRGPCRAEDGQLLGTRLAPDQWPPRRQIQAIIYEPYRLEALLSEAGQPVPEAREEETIADLRRAFRRRSSA